MSMALAVIYILRKNASSFMGRGKGNHVRVSCPSLDSTFLYSSLMNSRKMSGSMFLPSWYSRNQSPSLLRLQKKVNKNQEIYLI